MSESGFTIPAGATEGASGDEAPEARSHSANQIGKFGRNATSTSRRAAIDAYPRTGSQRHRLLVYVMRRPYGVICDEAEAFLELPHQSVSARWHELWRDYAYIEPNGEERKTRHGALAQVFVLTTRGREAMARAGDLYT